MDFKNLAITCLFIGATTFVVIYIYKSRKPKQHFRGGGGGMSRSSGGGGGMVRGGGISRPSGNRVSRGLPGFGRHHPGFGRHHSGFGRGHPRNHRWEFNRNRGNYYSDSPNSWPWWWQWWYDPYYFVQEAKLEEMEDDPCDCFGRYKDLIDDGVTKEESSKFLIRCANEKNC